MCRRCKGVLRCESRVKGCSERVLGFCRCSGFSGMAPGVYSDEYLTEDLMAERGSSYILETLSALTNTKELHD